jgi:hypothetical protein
MGQVKGAAPGYSARAAVRVLSSNRKSFATVIGLSFVCDRLTQRETYQK